MNAPERKVLEDEEIRRAIVRLAHEILERNQGVAELVLVGIRTRGVFLAERLRRQIQEIEGKEVPMGSLDITLYRDDLQEIGPNPVIRETELEMDLTEKIVILVDDVLYTGRTIRAALAALMEFGRPRAILLAVLIDRGHRELPIKADFVGKNLPTAAHEKVILRMKEKDEKDEVIILEQDDA